jgi:hypothetical protein
LKARSANARTYLYQDLFAQQVAELERTQRDFAAFVASLPELFKASDTIDGIPNVVKSAKVSLIPGKAPNAESLSLRISVRGGAGEKVVAWSELSPAEIGESFVLPRLTAFEPTVLLGLTRVFVELGELGVAEACLNQSVKVKAPFGEGEEVRLRAEVDAMQRYQELLRGVEATPRQRIELCNRFRSQNFTTHFFVLQDGASPLEVKSLLPEARRQEFLEHFGMRPQ